MPLTPTPAELEAFLDEALPAERMAAIEDALRGGDEALTAQLTGAIGRRDAGLHSLGAVWRRRRLTCPSREELGSFLLGVLEDDHADYIRFHIEVAGCRACQANLEDLQARQTAAEAETTERRERYFQSSVGGLRDASDS